MGKKVIPFIVWIAMSNFVAVDSALICLPVERLNT